MVNVSSAPGRWGRPTLTQGLVVVNVNTKLLYTGSSPAMPFQTAESTSKRRLLTLVTRDAS